MKKKVILIVNLLRLQQFIKNTKYNKDTAVTVIL